MTENSITQKTKIWIMMGIIGGLIVGYMFSYVNFNFFPKAKENALINKELTNPALNYEYGKSIMDNQEINLEKPLQDFIQEKMYNNETNHVSIYYRNLNNGNWFGINEKELFSPASLMKLPLLLVYLKKIEKDPSVREQKLTYVEDPIEAKYTQNIEPEKKLIDQKAYTIKELLEYMIKYSDNKASILLEKNIPLDEYKKTFTDNEMTFPSFINGKFDNNLKVVDYAKFFRILFNASYINSKFSNYAL